MTALKLISGRKGKSAVSADDRHAAAFRSLEPDICDMVRAVELVSLAEEHGEEQLTFAIEQCLRTAKELKQTYYDLWKD